MMVESRQRKRRLGMVAVQYAAVVLMLVVVSGWAQKPLQIELPPSYTLEVLDATVSQKGALVSVSGSARMSNPWAGTAWGYLEVSLLDEKGNLIRKVPVDYFPKPLARTYHSANEPRAFFAVNIDIGNQTVASVRIVYHD